MPPSGIHSGSYLSADSAAVFVKSTSLLHDVGSNVGQVSRTAGNLAQELQQFMGSMQFMAQHGQFTFVTAHNQVFPVLTTITSLANSLNLLNGIFQQGSDLSAKIQLSKKNQLDGLQDTSIANRHMPTQSYNAQTETTSVVSSVKNLAKNYGQGLLQTTAFMRQIYPQHRYNELNTIEQNFLAFQTISADEGAELKAVFSTYENNRYVLKGLQSKLLPLLEDATSLLEVLQEKIEYGYASVISAEDSEIDLPAGKLHPYEVIDDCELAQEKIGYLLDSLHVLSDKLNEHLTLQDSNMIENVRSFKRHEGMPTVKNLSEEVESVLTLVQKLGVYWAQRLPTSIHILKNMMGAKFFAGLDEFYQNVGSLQKLSFRALSVEQRGQEAEVKNLSEVFLELVKLKPAPLQKVGQ